MMQDRPIAGKILITDILSTSSETLTDTVTCIKVSRRVHVQLLNQLTNQPFKTFKLDVECPSKLPNLDWAFLLLKCYINDNGTISMIPVGIEFPKTGLFTIARVKISMLKDKGIW